MRALTHPRADLRGGNASDDSFAISKSILKPLVTLRTFSVDVRAFGTPAQSSMLTRTQRPLRGVRHGFLADCEMRSQRRKERDRLQAGARNHEVFDCTSPVTALERAPIRVIVAERQFGPSKSHVHKVLDDGGVDEER